MAAKNKSNEIKITRVYDAPVAMVWDAWADPKQAAQWWGPRGFTITTHAKDLKPGGFWKYTMHGPDGVDYENRTIYYEVEKHRRLVYDHGGSEDRPPLFRVTVLFTDLKGKTRMEMTMALPTPEEAEQARKFIKAAGGNSTWDRLAEYLEKGSSGKEHFVINRTFETSLDTMFEMWTKPERLAKWLSSSGAGMGFVMFGRTEDLKIRKPDLIVSTQQLTDKDGDISRPPGLQAWPETMLTTVNLVEEEPDLTRVTVTVEPTGNVTAAGMKAFVEMRGSMTQGWTGSFDKLEDFLESLQGPRHR